jgi:hypothetical protein
MHPFFQVIANGIGKAWRSFVGSANIDDHPLDENRIAEMSRRFPATEWGRELLTDAWPKLYGKDLTSETYHGCVSVLHTLLSNIRVDMSLSNIQEKITAVDESLKTSKQFVPNSHWTGGAALTIANAWERTEAGFTVKQLLIAFDSELIYASKMYVEAREREKAGQQLQ